TSNITKLNSSNYEAWRKAITAVLVTLSLWAHVLGTAARLENYFRPRGFGTRLVLRRRFFKLRMLPTETMVAWIARVDEYVGRLRGIGAVVPDDDIMVVLIEGLPKEYDGVITALDTVPDNMLTLGYIQHRLVNEFARTNGE
ncbi:hypothetical protein EXIGLDRAFT_587692, partial [Exidia glandulosa HHB12029]